MCTERAILRSNSTGCSKYQPRAAGCHGNGTPVQYSEQRVCQSLGALLDRLPRRFYFVIYLSLHVRCVNTAPRICFSVRLISEGWEDRVFFLSFFPDATIRRVETLAFDFFQPQFAKARSASNRISIERYSRLICILSGAALQDKPQFYRKWLRVIRKVLTRKCTSHGWVNFNSLTPASPLYCTSSVAGGIIVIHLETNPIFLS